MSRLVSTPEYKQVAEELWEVTRVGIFNCSRTSKTIIIPVGFQCNLASLPAFFTECGMLDRYDADIAAIFHDYLYMTHKLNRKESDLVFLDIMNITRNPKSRFKRQSFYWAVRLFGGRGYRRRTY